LVLYQIVKVFLSMGVKDLCANQNNQIIIESTGFMTM